MFRVEVLGAVGSVLIILIIWRGKTCRAPNPILFRAEVLGAVVSVLMIWVVTGTQIKPFSASNHRLFTSKKVCITLNY